MKLELRELKETVEALRHFCLVNSQNEIGQNVSKVLNYVDTKLREEEDKDKKAKEALLSKLSEKTTRPD